MNLITDFLVAIPASGGGLTSLWSDVLANWIRPIFLAAVAVFAIIFIKDRAWMKLIAFVGIAAVVGVLIFAGDFFFGSADGGLTGVAKNAAETINAITLPFGR